MAGMESLQSTREWIGQEFAEKPSGPYVTISRQHGCSGFALGLLLAEILNDDAPPGRSWRVYGREVLEQLATETNLAAELVDKIMSRKPELVSDFFRSFLGKGVPSDREIRNRITSIIRGMAFEGNVIFVGQGGAEVTAGIENGLHIRMEAPEDWRASQVSIAEKCSLSEARATIRRLEKERQYLHQIYEMRYPREPLFHIVYDRSSFSLTAIAKHVVHAMRLKNLV